MPGGIFLPQGRGIIMLPKEYLLRNSELCTGYLRTGDNADTGGDDSNTFREGYMSAGDSLRDTGYLRTDVETLRRSPLRREHTDTGGADSNTFKRNKSAGNNLRNTGYLRADVETLRRLPLKRECTDTGGADGNTFKRNKSAGNNLRNTGYLRTDVETLRRSPLRRECTGTGGADSNTFKRNKSAGNNYHYTTARTIPAEGDNFCRNIDEASAKGFSPS